MPEDRFSWIPVNPAVVTPPPTAIPKVGEIAPESPQGAFPWIPANTPAPAPVLPTAALLERPSPIPQLVRDVATSFPAQPVQARFQAPAVTPATVKEFPVMARDIGEAAQSIVRGVPAFAAGLAGQGIKGLEAAWNTYREKGPLGFTGMDFIKSFGTPEAKAAGEDIAEQLSYQPTTGGGAKVAQAAMLPFEALDKGWETLVNATTPDPQIRGALMFFGRAATFYVIPEATKYMKRVIAGGEKPSIIKMTSIMDDAKAELPDAVKPEFEAVKSGVEERLVPPTPSPEPAPELPKPRSTPAPELVQPAPAPTPGPPIAAPKEVARPIPEIPPVPTAPVTPLPKTPTDKALLKSAVAKMSVGKGKKPVRRELGERGFEESMGAGKEAVAIQAHEGIAAPPKAPKPLTKAEELAMKTKVAEAESATIEANKVKAKAGDPDALRDVADELLRGTGKDAESIGEFKKNAFMDGEEAKKVASRYAKGEIDFDTATTELRGMVEDAVPETRPIIERRGPGRLSDEAWKAEVEKAKRASEAVGEKTYAQYKAWKEREAGEPVDLNERYDKAKTWPEKQAILKLMSQRASGVVESALDKVSQEFAKDIPTEEPAVGLSVKQVKPAPQKTPAFKFEDAETEARFEGAKGIRPEAMGEKIKAFTTHIKHMATRTYEYLPPGAEFVEAKQALKNLEKQRAVSFDRTLRVLHGITVGQDRGAHDLFRRKVVLEDLRHEVNAGREVPFGFTKESLTNELGRIDSQIGQTPIVQEALAKRGKAWEALKVDYTKAAEDLGLDVGDKLTKEDYFRHMVLDYAEVSGVVGAGKKLRPPVRRSFLKKRAGTELDINTDYLEAETEVMSQMLYDIEQMRAIKRIKDAYDVADQLKARAKAEGAEDWHALIPEGKVAWQPQEGNILFTAYSIPERMAKALMEGEGVDLEKLATKVREVTAIGGKKPEWVIPEELAATLDNLTQKRPPSPVTQFAKGTLRAWKQWVLASPRRVAKYNIRNMTGDADAAFVGNPHGFTKVPRAVSELYDYFILKKPMSPEMTEWFRRGGMESTLQAQELGDIRNLGIFKNLYEKMKLGKKTPLQLVKKYWAVARLTTDFRESILRYANFLDYYESIKAHPKGEPRNFGASLREEIMALRDPADRAYRLSNELLGSYDEISVLGQRLREYVYPFWSWKELNFKRYMRLAKNAWADGKTVKMLGKTFAARTPVHAYRFAKFAVKATAFWSMLQAWNNTMYPDIERELPEEVRNRPHINLGRDKDGKAQYFTRIGALGDFLEWFGLDAAPNLVSSWLNGRKSLGEIATSMIEAPVNQVVNGMSPFYKTTAELLMGKTLFPDVFNARTIRDRGRYMAQQAGIEHEYDQLRGFPTRGYGKSMSEIFLYKSDPEEAAFRGLYDMKLDFLKKIGKGGGDAIVTPKSNALYWTKLAHKYGDREAEKRWLSEYVSYSYMEGEAVGKTEGLIRKGIRNGLITSLRNLHPLGGMSAHERATFQKNLDDVGKATLARATKFYNEVILGNLDLMAEELQQVLKEREENERK